MIEYKLVCMGEYKESYSRCGICPDREECKGKVRNFKNGKIGCKNKSKQQGR